MNRRTHHVLAAATALAALGTALVPLTATAATPPGVVSDLTIKAKQLADPSNLHVATEDGVLTRPPYTDDYRWWSYGSAEWRVIHPPVKTSKAVAAGPHTLAFIADSKAEVHFYDVRTGAFTKLASPSGQRVLGVAGSNVLTVGTSGTPQALHWLSLENGKVKDRPLANSPTWSYSLEADSGGNRQGMIIKITTSHHETYSYWVGISGEITPVPAGAELYGTSYVTRVQAPENMVGYKVWEANGPLGDEAGRLVTVPETSGWLRRTAGVVGGDLLVLRGNELLAHPISGGATRVVAKTVRSTQLRPDGGLIAAVETGSRWAAHRFTAGADGEAVMAKIGDTPDSARKIHSLTMENGFLTASASIADSTVLMRADIHDVARRTWATSADRTDLPGPCAAPAPCTDLQPAVNGRVVYRKGADLFSWDRDYYHFVAEPVRLPDAKPATPDHLQVSGRFAAYLSAADPARPIDVYDLDQRKKVRTLPAALGGTYALSGAWVWREKTAGVVEAVDLRSGRTVRTDTLAGCDIKALEAWATSVYWKCDKESGVYDTGTKKSTPLPAHNTARLGNGFVAWEAGGVLNSTDLTPAGTATKVIGKPGDPRPGRGWTVDRYINRIAYADVHHNVRTTRSGVPVPPVAVVDTDVPVTMTEGQGARKLRWWANQPLSQWKLTITDAAGRRVGGGYYPDGTSHPPLVTFPIETTVQLGAGTYTWTLTAEGVARTGGAPMTKKGTIRVNVPVNANRRTFSSADRPDVAKLWGDGKLQFQSISTPREERQKVTDAGIWPATSAMVPFGDLNGDRSSDLLARNTKGELRVYHKPTDGKGAASTAQKLLGPGWNEYDVLTYPGDVTGDGRPDLVTRQTATGDLYVHAADGKGGLKPRVKAAPGFKQYKQVAGAGDLNGDGIGDLLTVDTANTVRIQPGTGNGTFKAPVQLNGKGWGAGRNLFIGVGDVNGDGHHDLVSRNGDGTLLVNHGRGNLTVGNTEQYTTGWAKPRLY
ncbi:FG-GAP repeat domain-containing protein [Streptomyces sp. NPDC048603]|uniref:FG-GAP repeat domain-containing protein n=1 Tax=Streptomyces sp. NPDC048603 TaxID=3365577 RepID=UPI00371B6025